MPTSTTSSVRPGLHPPPEYPASTCCACGNLLAAVWFATLGNQWHLRMRLDCGARRGKTGYRGCRGGPWPLGWAGRAECLSWECGLTGVSGAGDEGRFTVLVRATRIVHIPCAGAWRLPLTKKVRTQSLEVFETVAGVLNDQVTDPAHARFRHSRTAQAALHGTQHLPMLRITEAVDQDVYGDANGADAEEQASSGEIQRAR